MLVALALFALLIGPPAYPDSETVYAPSVIVCPKVLVPLVVLDDACAPYSRLEVQAVGGQLVGQSQGGKYMWLRFDPVDIDTERTIVYRWRGGPCSTGKPETSVIVLGKGTEICP